MDLLAKTESSRMREMTNREIQNLKDLPIPPPPSPSPSPSESHQHYTHLEQLEASNLVPPELFTSIKRHDTPDFLSILTSVSVHGRVHISELMKKVTRAGNTMLHLAAIFHNPRILQPIAEHFPHLITKKNIKGDTVLHVAARSHNAELIRILLECYDRHFASNNNESEEGEESGEKAVVPFRIKNKHGNMALHEAVMAGNVEGVEVLFNAERSVTHCMNMEGKSALYLSVERGNYKIISILLQAPFWDRARHQGTSPLHALIFARRFGERTKYSASLPLAKSWLTNEERVSSRRPVPGEGINPNANHGRRTNTNKEILEEPKSMIISTDGRRTNTNREILEEPKSMIISTD